MNETAKTEAANTAPEFLYAWMIEGGRFVVTQHKVLRETTKVYHVEGEWGDILVRKSNLIRLSKRKQQQFFTSRESAVQNGRDRAKEVLAQAERIVRIVDAEPQYTEVKSQYENVVL